jgi:hypothetical protein
MLNDFGGNNGLWGDWISITKNPPLARATAPNMIGTGLTMEGIFQNAATFDLMNENSYRGTAVVDLQAWAVEYSHRRYGTTVAHATHAAEAAWRIFQTTVFDGNDARCSLVLGADFLLFTDASWII